MAGMARPTRPRTAPSPASPTAPRWSPNPASRPVPTSPPLSPNSMGVLGPKRVVSRPDTSAPIATTAVSGGSARPAIAAEVCKVLTSFLVAHPTVRVDLDERPSHRIVAAVAEHRAELGIVADTVDLGQLETRTLRADTLVVVTAPENPLTRHASVSYADVLNRPFVGLSRASALQEHLEGHALPLGSRPTRSCPGTPSIPGSAAAASSRSASTSRGPTATSPCASPPSANSPAPRVPCATTSPPAILGPSRQPQGRQAGIADRLRKPWDLCQMRILQRDMIRAVRWPTFQQLAIPVRSVRIDSR